MSEEKQQTVFTVYTTMKMPDGRPIWWNVVTPYPDDDLEKLVARLNENQIFMVDRLWTRPVRDPEYDGITLEVKRRDRVALSKNVVEMIEIARNRRFVEYREDA